MCDPATGGGYDGLTATGRNLNQGAESTLALHLHRCSTPGAAGCRDPSASRPSRQSTSARLRPRSRAGSSPGCSCPGEERRVARIRAPARHRRGSCAPRRREVSRLLRDVLDRFAGRHRDLRGDASAHHYDLVAHRCRADTDSPRPAGCCSAPTSRHEYAVEAAALCNPSMVAHPDQTGLGAGQLRFAVSLRADRRGAHLLDRVPHRGDRPGRPARPRATGPARWRSDSGSALGTVGDLLARRPGRGGLRRRGRRHGARRPARAVRRGRPRTGARRPAGRPARPRTRLGAPSSTLRAPTPRSYARRLPADTALHQRVLWPATPAESNGMEDARFVRFVDDDRAACTGPPTPPTTAGSIATRAAGQQRPASLRDDRRCAGRPPATRGSRCFRAPSAAGTWRCAAADGETIGSDHSATRQPLAATPVPLHAPRRELGADPGRQLRLADRDRRGLARAHPRRRADAPVRDRRAAARPARPERVVADLPGRCSWPPTRTSGTGTCPTSSTPAAALVHDGELWLPYGASDARVGFATVSVPALLSAMVQAPPPVTATDELGGAG